MSLCFVRSIEARLVFISVSTPPTPCSIYIEPLLCLPSIVSPFCQPILLSQIGNIFRQLIVFVVWVSDFTFHDTVIYLFDSIL